MKLSERLKHIIKFIPKCDCLADIGTDHGYIPIHCVNNKLCNKAIACDIKDGPIKIANKNIVKYGLGKKIETRIGSGLTVLKKDEADVIVIAGMGGVLICEILKESSETVTDKTQIIMQPIQYPEVLRYYLINNGFNIIDEDIVMDEKKFYHIVKAVKGKSKPYEKEIYYYTGFINVEKKHPLLGQYIEYKIDVLLKIINGIDPKEQGDRYTKIMHLINDFKEVLKSL